MRHQWRRQNVVGEDSQGIFCSLWVRFRMYRTRFDFRNLVFNRLWDPLRVPSSALLEEALYVVPELPQVAILPVFDRFWLPFLKIWLSFFFHFNLLRVCIHRLSRSFLLTEVARLSLLLLLRLMLLVPSPRYLVLGVHRHHLAPWNTGEDRRPLRLHLLISTDHWRLLHILLWRMLKEWLS